MKMHTTNSFFKTISAMLMILLTVSVLFSSTGLYYTRHFCHGNPTGLKLFNSIEISGKCSCKAEAFNAHGCQKTIASDDCCVEFDHYLKSDIQSEKYSSFRVIVFLPVVEIPFESINTISSSTADELTYYNHPPPVAHTGTEIVILNQSLRIPLS